MICSRSRMHVDHAPAAQGLIEFLLEPGIIKIFPTETFCKICLENMLLIRMVDILIIGLFAFHKD